MPRPSRARRARPLPRARKASSLFIQLERPPHQLLSLARCRTGLHSLIIRTALRLWMEYLIRADRQATHLQSLSPTALRRTRCSRLHYLLTIRHLLSLALIILPLSSGHSEALLSGPVRLTRVQRSITPVRCHRG